MKLNELESHVLAYFLSNDALDFSIDPRFHERRIFVEMFEDRIYFGTRNFSKAIGGRHPNVANELVDSLIESQALSTTTDQFTGVAHKFDSGKYRACIQRLIDTNEICQRARARGPQFWEETFARLGNGSGVV